MTTNRRTFDPRRFERDLLAVRAIHASELPDCSVNELIRLQIGNRHPTNYEIVVANRILESQGYFPNKGP